MKTNPTICVFQVKYTMISGIFHLRKLFKANPAEEANYHRRITVEDYYSSSLEILSKVLENAILASSLIFF
jgi:hypothetical protein